MANNPVGTKLIATIGSSSTGMTAATTEYFTAQQIGNLAGAAGGSGIIIIEAF